MVGGLGLFFLGMNLLTENLKTLAGRRMRIVAARWTQNQISGLAWGTIAGGITQSTPALTFIVVSMLRSGLLSVRTAIPILIGGNLGVTLLVLLLTLDVRLIALYMLGIAGAVMLSEKGLRYRAGAASVVGIAMMFFGLVLIKNAAAPLAAEPWFEEILIWSGGSLLLSFLAAAVLTFIMQSSSAVRVFGITMATIGVLSIDQVIMYIYGCTLGALLITLVLSTSLKGSSRQVVMFQVLINLLTCALVVPTLFVEFYFAVPLMKAAVLSFDLPLAQQLSIVFILLSFLPGMILLAARSRYVTLSARFWPETPVEELSRTRYIHDHASDDAETSVILVGMEQNRMIGILSKYLDAVRTGKQLAGFRQTATEISLQISDFLKDLDMRHPTQAIEDRYSIRNRQTILNWLEEQVGELCVTLMALPEESPLYNLRNSLLEGIDAVLLVIHDAQMDIDEELWSYVEQLTGDRRKLMQDLVRVHVNADLPLDASETLKLLQITNSTEQIFFLLSRYCSENDPVNQVRGRSK